MTIDFWHGRKYSAVYPSRVENPAKRNFCSFCRRYDDAGLLSRQLFLEAFLDAPFTNTESRLAAAARVHPGIILLAFLRLGCTSFGGPIAHLGYFQEEFVARRRWLAPTEFAELIAVAQTLPGPASSQVGFAIGLLKGGLPGGLAAWTGFTLPSAMLMVAFALAQSFLTGAHAHALSHALQLVAVAVVAQAVLSMQRTLAPDLLRISIAVLAACLALLLPGTFNIFLDILIGALAGLIFCRHSIKSSEPASSLISLPRRAAIVSLCLFVSLLLLSLLAPVSPSSDLRLFSTFYRSGALVFGGGHVVLPLLESATVSANPAPNSVSESVFLSGYGAAQAIPGPLFTFAAYLGAVMHGLAGACLALAGIFLPGLLLMAGVLPFWKQLRSQLLVRAALIGVNASVVGVLAAALYRPLWATAVYSALDLVFALIAFLLLVQWRIRPWVIVLGAATLSQFLFI